MDTSPRKRRVLAALDINSKSPAAKTSGSPLKPAQSKHLQPVYSKDGTSKKRGIEGDRPTLRPDDKHEYEQENGQQQPPAKKSCTSVAGIPSTARSRSVMQQQQRERSGSPDDSSIFDAAHDMSQSTTITEPDTEATTAIAPPPPPQSRPRAPTRDEARRKAEILRLRLGLARYKVQTGQENVSFDQLKVRQPLSRPNMDEINNNDGDYDDDDDGENHPPSSSAPQPELPPLPSSHQDDDSSRRRAGSEQPQTLKRKALPSGRGAQTPRSMLSPEKSGSVSSSLLPKLPSQSYATPTRTTFKEEDTHLLDSGGKGGAAKGLLTLSQAHS